MQKHLLVEAAAYKWKVGKFTAVVHNILPEGVDDDDEVWGDAHVAADEAADEAHVARALPVVVDHLNQLYAVVDEGDHC